MATKKIVIKQILFPKKADRVDFFKAAVFYILADSNAKPIFIECEKREESELEDPKVKAIIKAAVPGYNSTLMRLEIESNVNQYIIDDNSLDLNQKIEKIADSIRRYVQISA